MVLLVEPGGRTRRLIGRSIWSKDIDAGLEDADKTAKRRASRRPTTNSIRVLHKRQYGTGGCAIIPSREQRFTMSSYVVAVASLAIGAALLFFGLPTKSGEMRPWTRRAFMWLPCFAQFVGQRAPTGRLL